MGNKIEFNYGWKVTIPEEIVEDITQLKNTAEIQRKNAYELRLKAAKCGEVLAKDVEVKWGVTGVAEVRKIGDFYVQITRDSEDKIKEITFSKTKDAIFLDKSAVKNPPSADVPYPPIFKSSLFFNNDKIINISHNSNRLLFNAGGPSKTIFDPNTEALKFMRHDMLMRHGQAYMNTKFDDGLTLASLDDNGLPSVEVVFEKKKLQTYEQKKLEKAGYLFDDSGTHMVRLSAAYCWGAIRHSKESLAETRQAQEVDPSKDPLNELLDTINKLMKEKKEPHDKKPLINPELPELVKVRGL